MQLKSWIGITDKDWFNLLKAQGGLEEVNFWQPSGSRQFRALEPLDPFLFKLHSPDNFIVGGGFFAHFSLLPVSLAWDTFGISNGATSLHEMRTRIEKYRRDSSDRFEDYTIGCILLESPFFFDQKDWIPVPDDWKSNIVQGRTYDLQSEPGKSLWKAVEGKLQDQVPSPLPYEQSEGAGQVIFPRLGQGSFRVLVTDAYTRRCAVTRERTLPALDAAHIIPFSESGGHRVDNGILLRKDIHALFDKGYITVTPQLKVEVSQRIKEEFENGRDYYKLHGAEILVPKADFERPSVASLRWHNEQVFRG